MEKRSTIAGRYATILIGVLILIGLYVSSRYSYLLFHVLAETFSITVAWAIFMVSWNTRQFHDNDYLSFIGIAYLFIGGIDLLHTLAYKGMDIFQGYDADLPTQLWIAARYMESISLLIAPLLLHRRSESRLVLLGYAAATALLLAAIFHWRIFPACYVEGTGLTPFKKISEYVISLILLASAALLFRERDRFDRGVLRLLIASTTVTIASELAFTFYISVYGFSNLVGHFFKIMSFYFIYKALVETGLVRPYGLLFRDLKQSEEALRQYTAKLEARNEDLGAFAHTVAHDLSTPLAVIVGFADILESTFDQMAGQEIRKHLRTMVASGHKMSNIIDELLLLAGVRTEQVIVEALDMAGIVAEAQQRLAHLTERHQAEIAIPDTWPVALGYGPWIEEVWVNYLGNALEYGGRPPRIELGAEIEPDGMARFWIRDNGPGISQEEQSRLFIPFTHPGQAHTKGHGLGLSIVRRIVEKLGGQVDVESEPGHGSTFSFTLPSAVH
jgi:signal transduction histidine kinase